MSKHDYHTGGIDIYHGNCLDILPTLEALSVQCCVTSPPYWGLRDYGTATWSGGDSECDHLPPEDSGESVKQSDGQRYHAGRFAGPTCHKCGAAREDDQLGLESTPEEYIENMVDVFREVWRVLRVGGTLWLNLGDTYNSGASGGRDLERWPKQSRNNHRTAKPSAPRLKHKDLVGIPWRVALALQANGWHLRQDIIWKKPNPMPESVTDRCTKAHEYIFLMTKSATYWYDAEAIKEPCSPNTHNKISTEEIVRITKERNGGANTSVGHGRSRKKTVAVDGMTKNNVSFDNAVCLPVKTRNKRSVWTVATHSFAGAHFATFPPKLIEPCILAGCPEGGLVLDPFHGAGTTAMVAQQNGRRYVGCELNAEYIELSKTRLQQPSLF